MKKQIAILCVGLQVFPFAPVMNATQAASKSSPQATRAPKTGAGAAAQPASKPAASKPSSIGLRAQQETGLTPEQIAAIKRDPKTGVQEVLGISYDALVEEVKAAAKSPNKTIVERRNLKKTAEMDPRYKRAHPAERPAIDVKSSGAIPSSSRLPTEAVVAAAASGMRAQSSMLLAEKPLSAVVLSHRGAEDLSSVVLPRMVGLALEDYISANRLDTQMDPIFPDEQGNSEQSTTYTRSSSSLPASGVFRIHQGKTDLTYHKEKLTDKLWFDYNVNLKKFDLQVPIHSSTFDLEFKDNDEIQARVDIGNDFEIGFDAKFKVSTKLEVLLIAGGALLTILLGWINPLLGAFILAIVVIVETLEGQWLPLTASLRGTEVKSLVLQVDTTESSPYLIRDLKSVEFDVGEIEILGDGFQKFLDALAKLFNNRIAEALGLEGTSVESCSSLRDCVNDIAKIYFLRGSLTAGSDEECWRGSGSARALKSDPKSLKCTLVSTLNLALQNSVEVGLTDAIRLAVAKKSALVDDRNLQVLFETGVTSVASRESCTGHLSEYQPRAYPVVAGGGKYDLTPKGDTDLFLTLNSVEEVIHQKLLEGEFCSKLVKQESSNSGGMITRKKLSLRPEGQFEIVPGFTLEGADVTAPGPVAAGASMGASMGRAPSGISEVEFTDAAVRSFSLVAPFSGEYKITTQAGGLKKVTTIRFRAKGNTLAQVRLSCSSSKGLIADLSRGWISELRGEVTSPTGVVSDCSDSSCEFYDSILEEATSMLKKVVAAMDAAKLPTLEKYADAKLYLSLDSDEVDFISDKALRIPLEVTTSDPCSESGGSGGSSGSSGSGGSSGGIPGGLPRPSLDGFPGERGREGDEPGTLDSGLDPAEAQGF